MPPLLIHTGILHAPLQCLVRHSKLNMLGLGCGRVCELSSPNLRLQTWASWHFMNSPAHGEQPSVTGQRVVPASLEFLARDCAEDPSSSDIKNSKEGKSRIDLTLRVQGPK